MSSEKPDAAQPDEVAPEDPIDDPRASRGDLVVPILVFVLLVLGIGRSVHQGSADPAPPAPLGAPSDTDEVIAEIHS